MDLSFTFTYSVGGYSYDSGAGKLDKEGTTNGLDANIPIYYRERWRKPGDESIYGIYIANNKWDLADGYSNSRKDPQHRPCKDEEYKPWCYFAIKVFIIPEASGCKNICLSKQLVYYCKLGYV
ncbi:MAG: hypothetical protein MZV63_17485 [Marinilabiliales bacterium]|nr:hypothetical protein [Marinilabiliales bacterium]